MGANTIDLQLGGHIQFLHNNLNHFGNIFPKFTHDSNCNVEIFLLQMFMGNKEGKIVFKNIGVFTLVL